MKKKLTNLTLGLLLGVSMSAHAQKFSAEEVKQRAIERRGVEAVIWGMPAVNLIDDKAGKPVGIQMHIGRRPIAAFGNSDGDQQMLEWTVAGPGARFCLIVHHDDAEREWAYDRQSHIGKLDKAWDEAKAKGWTVVSMKDDWKTIFPPATQ